MSTPDIGDRVKVKEGYVDESGEAVRAGYLGRVVAIGGDVAMVELDGFIPGVEFPHSLPLPQQSPHSLPVPLEWLELASGEDG